MFNQILRISYGFAQHTKFCVIGGGTAGINLSAHLLRQKILPGDIRIFEPSKYHYYQPGWTMVGNNMVDPETTRKLTSEMIPEGTQWTKQKVVKVDPTKNLVITNEGREFTYDHLIVSSGIQIDWNKIKGMKQLLDDPNSNVCSIYDYNYAQKTGKLAKNFKGGKAVFSQPALPIKCPGAPQKILYLWTDIWRKNNIKADVDFLKHGAVLFVVPKYSEKLSQIAKGYGINVALKHNLVQITPQTAIFENVETKERVVKPYDFLHAVPPMSAPAFLKESGISNEAGYVDVDKHTLRHNKYPNIWSLGDSSSVPNSKTAAAVFSQTQVLVQNLTEVLKNPNATQLPAKHEGYTSCPLFVGGGKLMLAEFKYDTAIDETFFNDQQKPRTIFYYLKKDFFRFAYWKLMPRGLWNGRKGIKWA